MAGVGQRAWRCGVCGYVHAGEEAPDLCPVCGAAASEFEAYRDAAAPAAPSRSERRRCVNCGYIHEGAALPEECPVCGASAERFESSSLPQVQGGVEKTRAVILGGGIAAISAAEALRKASPDSEIVLVTKEPELPYYRLNLTRYLAGEIQRDALPLHPLEWYAEQRIELVHDSSAERIDVAGREVALQDGNVVRYGKLLIATGSHPFIPPVAGGHLQGVFALRTVVDADAILAKAGAGAACVCIGGGVLGIETAGALARQGTSVALLEAHDWLMPRQLNRTASGYLERYMQAIGVEVLKNARTKQILGRDAVSGVALEDGREVDADVVIFATGVRPNTALARRSGLEVTNGIVVDNFMRTSAPDVFAAGDVAEHNGQVYGSWAASLYQGAIAAMNMAGTPTPFGGLPRANTIKALGLDITSIGKFVPEDGSYQVVEQQEKTTYMLFVFKDSRMVGAILIGRSELTGPVKKAVESGTTFAGLLQGRPRCADIVNRLRAG